MRCYARCYPKNLFGLHVEEFVQLCRFELNAQAWNQLRTLTEVHPRLFVAIEVTADLPEPVMIERWLAEPVKVPPGTYVFTLWLSVLCMCSKDWLAARVSFRLARLPCTASSAQRSRRLRSTRAAAPVLLAHADITKI